MEGKLAAGCLIGIDVGTTGVKAILIDTAGTRVAGFSQPISMSRPQTGRAEQNPDDWMQATLAALSAFQSGHDLTDLLGIGICSQVNTHVFVAPDGTALLPAITWQDGRAGDDARALDEKVAPEQKLRWFGAPIPIDASHALSRMAHIRRVAPGVFQSTAHVLLPKDYCIMHLTGAIESDPISAVGLTDASLRYVDELLALVPGAAGRLPPLHPITHVAGRVRAGLPCAGAPVVAGVMDAWAGMFGTGVARDGEATYQSGTSEIPGVVARRVRPTPGVIVFPVYQGITLHAAPTQSGGAALSWLAGILGRPPAELAAEAAAVEPSKSIPLFLPHLEGERAPLWDAASRGAFVRLDARVGAPEMIRSVMEGVAFSVRLAFDALQRSAGMSLEVANLGGGGSRSDAWCQIRADTLGFSLRRAAVADVAALGAAILAGLGAGAFQSLQAAVAELVRFDHTFEPNPANRGYYDEKYGNYLALYETLRPFNARY
jgi:xylulokinase